MLLLPPSPPVQWRLSAVSTSRTHSQARELRAGACVGSCHVGHVPQQHVGAGHCRVGFSPVGHVSVMSSETLARRGARGRLVVLGATMSRGKRLDGLPVSMVLTSQAHRRRTPKKNRRIPTIPTGRVDGWIVHVSAVDTGPRGSESGVLGDRARRCGTTATTASDPASSAAPSPCHLGPITRHQRHDLKHRALSGARAKARRPWFDADPARTEPAPPRSCPESAYSTRVGIY